jgi:hypothetical protein
VAILLVVGHFFPAVRALLSADIKKRSGLLAKVAIFILVMRLIDLIWYVAPAFRHMAPEGAGGTHSVIPMHWMDIADSRRADGPVGVPVSCVSCARARCSP